MVERAAQMSPLEHRPRTQHVSAWGGDIRFSIASRLAEMGIPIRFTPVGEDDEFGAEKVDIDFDTPEASHLFHKVWNCGGARILQNIVRSNPHSPHRETWVQNGLTDILPDGRVIIIQGVNQLIPQMTQLEIPANE